jgi:hypothetical protein
MCSEENFSVNSKEIENDKLSPIEKETSDIEIIQNKDTMNDLSSLFQID